MTTEKTSADLSATPKMKAEFEQWYVKRYAPNLAKHEITCDATKHFCAAHFTPMHFEMQQGVYLAFLRDKHQLFLTIRQYPMVCDYTGNSSMRFDYEVYSLSTNTSYGYSREFKGYNLALVAAIEAGFKHLEAAKSE